MRVPLYHEPPPFCTRGHPFLNHSSPQQSPGTAVRLLCALDSLSSIPGPTPRSQSNAQASPTPPPPPRVLVSLVSITTNVSLQKNCKRRRGAIPNHQKPITRQNLFKSTLRVAHDTMQATAQQRRRRRLLSILVWVLGNGPERMGAPFLLLSFHLFVHVVSRIQFLPTLFSIPPPSPRSSTSPSLATANPTPIRFSRGTSIFTGPSQLKRPRVTLTIFLAPSKPSNSCDSGMHSTAFPMAASSYQSTSSSCFAISTSTILKILNNSKNGKRIIRATPTLASRLKSTLKNCANPFYQDTAI